MWHAGVGQALATSHIQPLQLAQVRQDGQTSIAYLCTHAHPQIWRLVGLCIGMQASDSGVRAKMYKGLTVMHQ